MKTYLVGGAVRDRLLGLEAKDLDYVVVGSTVEQMLASGFQQVGKAFPVFLHPETKCEYALARIERKNGHGYGGFAFDFSPDVTLEEDLFRRDLTINAMAMDESGGIVDPYGGQQDLKNRILRHVGPAFGEDPLRVLRVARFASRYAHLGFAVAPETMELMRKLAESGELSYLTSERIFGEFEKVLKAGSLSVFIRVLRQCGALKAVFPEMDALYGIPARRHWHPEIDTGIHMELCLDYAVKNGYSPIEKFALFCHDFGKALTPKEILPSHHGHGPRGVSLIEAFAERLRAPREYRVAACYVAEFHSHVHTALYKTPEQIMELFENLGAFRFPERMTVLLDCCTADIGGRLGFENLQYTHAGYLRDVFEHALQVDVKKVVADGFKGQGVKDELARRRLEDIESYSRIWLKEHADLVSSERREDPAYLAQRAQRENSGQTPAGNRQRAGTPRP